MPERKYKTAKQMDEKVDEYVDLCKIEKKPLTITGLCLHLGFASRSSFSQYGKLPEFVESVDRARLLVENQYEGNLVKRGVSPVGSIFALKQFGWEDKAEVKHTAEQEFMEMVLGLNSRNRKEAE